MIFVQKQCTIIIIYNFCLGHGVARWKHYLLNVADVKRAAPFVTGTF